MVTAILGLITAIVGMVSGMFKNSAASLQQMLQITQANVEYAREKEITYYQAYQQLIKIIGIILIGGIVIIGIIYYFNR